jgi:hypothetical protein
MAKRKDKNPKKPQKPKKRGRPRKRVNLSVKFYWQIYRALKAYYKKEKYEVEPRLLRIYTKDANKYLEEKARREGRQRQKEIDFFIKIIDGGEPTKLQREELFEFLNLPFPEFKISSGFWYWELESETISIPRGVNFVINYTLIGDDDAFFEGVRGEIPYSEIVNKINDYVRYGGMPRDSSNVPIWESIILENGEKLVLLNLVEQDFDAFPSPEPEPEPEPEEGEEGAEEKPKGAEKGDKPSPKEQKEKERKAKAEADKADIEKLFALLNGKLEEQSKVLDILIKKKQAGISIKAEQSRIKVLEKEIDELRKKIDEMQ